MQNSLAVIKISKLYQFLFLIVILLQINLFDVFNLPIALIDLNSPSNKMLILMVLMVVLFLTIVLLAEGKVEFKDAYFSWPMIFLFLIVVIGVYASSNKYSESVRTAFANSYYFLIIPIGYFAFKPLFYDEKTLESLSKVNMVVAAIYSFVYLMGSSILPGIIHSTSSVDIQNFLTHKSVMGFIRYQTPSDYIFFSLFFFWMMMVMTFKNKLSIWMLMSNALSLLYLIFVAQVRTYEILVLVLLLAYGLTKVSDVSKSSKVLMGILFSIVSVTIIAIIINKLQFFSGARASSAAVRLEEIPYFLGHWRDMGILGMGFPDSKSNYYLLHGFSPKFMAPVYYLDDVGIFGFVGQLGLLGIIFLASIAVVLTKKLVRNGFTIQKGIFICTFLATFPTLIVFNVQRSVVGIFYFLLIDFALHLNKVSNSR